MLALGSFGDGRTDSLFWGLGLGLENQYLPPHLIPSTSNTLKQLGTCAMVTRVAGGTFFYSLANYHQFSVFSFSSTAPWLINFVQLWVKLTRVKANLGKIWRGQIRTKPFTFSKCLQFFLTLADLFISVKSNIILTWNHFPSVCGRCGASETCWTSRKSKNWWSFKLNIILN